MSGLKRKRSHKRRRLAPGATPGSIIPDPSAPKPVVRVLAYSPDRYIEESVPDLEVLPRYLKEWPVCWVHVEGLGDAATLHKLGDFFGLHRLALEDVVNTHQRPKMDAYLDQIFLVGRMLDNAQPGQTEQLSLFLGKGYVLTFLERAGNVSVEAVRKRVRDSRGRVRLEGADFLAYCLMDALIDSFFPPIDDLSESLEDLEDEVVARATPATLAKIHRAKRELLLMRRAIAPLRDAINALLRDTGSEISDTARLFFRDCHDHTFQILDLVETQREIVAGLLDIYLSSVSNRMNEVMKVLTIIATLFIPLTFLAGVYGMNFAVMPELHWRWGYPALWLVMIGIVTVELYAFRRMGWIGGKRKRGQEAGDSGLP